jgi:hypothetical protein
VSVFPNFSLDPSLLLQCTVPVCSCLFIPYKLLLPIPVLHPRIVIVRIVPCTAGDSRQGLCMTNASVFKHRHLRVHISTDHTLSACWLHSSFSFILGCCHQISIGCLNHVQVVTTQATYKHSLYAADLDGDGDLDLMSVSEPRWVESEIAWYENQGNGSFGPQQVRSRCIIFVLWCAFEATLAWRIGRDYEVMYASNEGMGTITLIILHRTEDWHCNLGVLVINE